MIKLINEWGNKSKSIERGSMNITSHHAVLKALAQRAERFKNKGGTLSVEDRFSTHASDKTGTINSAILYRETELHEHLEKIEQQEISRVDEIGIPEEILRVHGSAPG